VIPASTAVACATVDVRTCASSVPGCTRYEVFDAVGFLWGVDILAELVTPDMLLFFRLYYEQHPRPAPPAVAPGGLRLMR
jgi:hypothetical protein